MQKIYKTIIGSVILAGMVVFSASAKEIKVKGDPELLWLSPLGNSDIENNAYNRCRLIKLIKPGAGKTSESNKNNYDIFSNYVSNLYAQSIKISAYIAEEEENEANNASSVNTDNELALIEEEIIQRMANISRRINIINSFEAGISMLDSLEFISSLGPTTYEEFRALHDGKYDYVSDCELLKN